MGAFVEEFSEKRDEVSLEDDFLEASWSRYHADIAAVQRDIHLLRSEVTHRLTALVREECQSGWLRQRIRALEINLDAMFLWRMRECAFKRAKRAQAIRKFCDGKGELERSS
ncbi:hypothetical protein HYW11_00480 [Candidatus Peregrinibacteria bacterium]|nr:hypothetical protein [Candidatus Peregrinibacteria bacterium]